MSLNLGLESLGIVTDDVSLESVLMAESDFADAQISLERACFIVATEARNISNFNEIVSSLKRHSSQECVAFAQDLLGTASLEEIESVPGTPAKVSLGGKVKNAWDAFVEWIKKAWAWASKNVKKLLAKLKLTGNGAFNGELKVHYTLDQLNQFQQASPIGITRERGMNRKPEMEKILKLEWLAKKPAGTKIKLGEEADKYFDTLLHVHSDLYYVLRNIGGSGKNALQEKTVEGKKKFGVDQNYVNWSVALMKRLRPFFKNVMKDYQALANRAMKSAYGVAKQNEKFGKMASKNDNSIDAKKVGKSLGGEKEEY